jgi:hypothetical protein
LIPLKESLIAPHPVSSECVPPMHPEFGQRVLDNDADYVEPQDMLAELREDNKALTRACARHTASAKSTTTSPPQA